MLRLLSPFTINDKSDVSVNLLIGSNWFKVLASLGRANTKGGYFDKSKQW